MCMSLSDVLWAKIGPGEVGLEGWYMDVVFGNRALEGYWVLEWVGNLDGRWMLDDWARETAHTPPFLPSVEISKTYTDMLFYFVDERYFVLRVRLLPPSAFRATQADLLSPTPTVRDTPSRTRSAGVAGTAPSTGNTKVRT